MFGPWSKPQPDPVLRQERIPAQRSPRPEADLCGVPSCDVSCDRSIDLADQSSLQLKTMIELSVVATLYRSAPFFAEFIRRITAAASDLTPSFEIILVDDGSPDDGLQMAIAAAKEEPRIRVVELSRNFGHHAAILAGLQLARGERTFLIDSDLEEPPELIGPFAERMALTNADVVYGLHEQKVGTRMRQTTSGLFWRLFNMLSDTRTEENICHVRLMRREYLDALLSLGERNVFLGGLYMWPGFRQVSMSVDRNIRRETSTYSAVMRIGLAVRSVIAFSARPLHLIFFFGTIISALSGIVALTVLMLRIFWEQDMAVGFASLIISIWFLGGVILMALGVIGLYLSEIYVEAKRRPRSIVRRIHEAAPVLGNTAGPSRRSASDDRP